MVVEIVRLLFDVTSIAGMNEGGVHKLGKPDESVDFSLSNLQSATGSLSRGGAEIAVDLLHGDSSLSEWVKSISIEDNDDDDDDF